MCAVFECAVEWNCLRALSTVVALPQATPRCSSSLVEYCFFFLATLHQPLGKAVLIQYTQAVLEAYASQREMPVKVAPLVRTKCATWTVIRINNDGRSSFVNKKLRHASKYTYQKHGLRAAYATTIYAQHCLAEKYHSLGF